MKVFLREKKLSKGRRSLYLDFYPPIPHPETRKPTRREHLKLYIYEKPKSKPKENITRKPKSWAKICARKDSSIFKAVITDF
jgi:hypothetical protein